MLTHAQRKEITALHRKKGRDERGLFLAEGPKLVHELLSSSLRVEYIIALKDWAHLHSPDVPVYVVSPEELQRVSAMETPHQVLAVAHVPAPPLPPRCPTGLILALDGLQDPGNLGTILRTADWFGVEHVVASKDSVDIHNPKVIQSSMGSAFRVPYSRIPLSEWMHLLPPSTQIIGACLDGVNVYSVPPALPAVLVIGSEGQGISREVADGLHHRVTLPRLGRGESLNAAIATALLCAEWKRNQLAP